MTAKKKRVPAAPGEEDYLDRAATSRQFPAKIEKIFGRPDMRPHADHCSRTGRRTAPEPSPAPPLFLPIERRRHGQDLA